jgi:hypothetical protein
LNIHDDLHDFLLKSNSLTRQALYKLAGIRNNEAMRKLNRNGFIPLLLTILAVVIGVILLAYFRVASQ